MKAYVESYGCTLNRGEAEIFEDSLRAKGFEVVSSPGEADKLFVFTCAVIEHTERKIIRRLEELSKLKKETSVLGCLAVYKSREIDSIPFTSAVKKVDFEDLMIESASKRLVATLPISTGCMGNCSYCATKLIRGRLRSYDPDTLLRRAKILLKNGAKELRVTSQDSACYGFDGGGFYLPDIIDSIADLKGKFRIRVGMMTPDSFFRIENDLLESFKNEKIYKFFHLPLQSGDDEILRDMGRNYTLSQFMHGMDRIRDGFENFTLSTDLLVGYPCMN